MELAHIPVLYDQVLACLDPRPNADFVDATLGAGGHALGILERTGPRGRLLGFETDPTTLALAAGRLARFGSRPMLVNRNFADLASVAAEHSFFSVAGVFFDLGLSSLALAPTGRGFSFQHDAPLDMRFDPRQPVSAAEIVNCESLGDLTRLLREFGEEPRARAVARAIVQARAAQPITSTTQLAAIVAPTAAWSQHLHPATRTFQALRIATNRELEVLAEALPQAVSLLAEGGRMAVISFHSLEDRIVKQFFAAEQRGCICPPRLPVCVCGRQPRLRTITKKPIVPSEEEIHLNPRSRSAKLRVAERVS